MADIKKILIVDDDASLINLLKEHLSSIFKQELYVALTGEEALKIIEEKKPNVVLLDMQLPGIKGTQVLRVIREKYPVTKVLVLTSYDREVKETVEKLGVDGFFPKPIELNEVIKRIGNVLKTEGDTRVIPLTLEEQKKKEGVMPKAKILFIEREHWMPYLLPIADTDRSDDYVIEPYGDYEYKEVYCQKDALKMLTKFKPDIVICAADVPEDEPYGSENTSVADLILKIKRSKHAPKAVIVHGSQQNVNSFGIKDVVDGSMIWIEPEDIHTYDEEKDKENAERLNKMIWRTCFIYNLVTKA